MEKGQFDTLTLGQKAAYNAVTRGFNTFITGGGGVGKSYLIRLLIKELENQGKQVIVCAPTGVAAELIGGATIHRVFSLGTGPQITKKGSIKTSATAPVKQADVIIIDEVSMVRADLFDCVLASIRSAERKSNKHKQIIVTGDFYQLPPVTPDVDRQQLKEYIGRDLPVYWAFLGKSWNSCSFKTIILDEIVRQHDRIMMENLNKCRVGDSSCIPYFNENTSPTRTTWDFNLYTHRSDVDRENNWQINKLSTKPYKIARIYKGIPLNPSELDVDDNGRDGTFILKEGTRVMLTRNDTEKDPLGRRKTPRYVNGSMGVVKGICLDPADPRKDYILVQIEKTRDILEIYRASRLIYGYDEKNGKLKKTVVGRFYEIPIIPAYALTIHKSQGATYDFVNIDPTRCFAAGQLYVALSRAKTIVGIHLTRKICSSDLITDPTVRDFYANLRNNTEEFAKNKVGRPKINKPEKEKVRVGNPGRFGSPSVAVRIPEELAGPLMDIINKAFPTKQEIESGTKPDRKAYEQLLKRLTKKKAEEENATDA